MAEDERVFDELQELMLDQARKVYSEKVVDHFLRPRNHGELPNADCSTFMSGICGDTIGIYVKMDNGRIGSISFVTNGCGPTIACSSALTCLAQGRTLDEAKSLSAADIIAYLERLPIENTHCADLAVNTLRGALAKIE